MLRRRSSFIDDMLFRTVRKSIPPVSVYVGVVLDGFVITCDHNSSSWAPHPTNEAQQCTHNANTSGKRCTPGEQPAQRWTDDHK